MDVYIYKWSYSNNRIVGNSLNYTIELPFTPWIYQKTYGNGIKLPSIQNSDIVNVNIKYKYHQNIVTQFLAINKLTQCTWINIKEYNITDKIITCNSKNITKVIKEIPIIHILIFDIEAYSKRRSFPDPELEEDLIICIGTYSNINGYKTFVNNGSEHDMVISFYKYILNNKVNFIVGFNSHGFDWKYILTRHNLNLDIIHTSWTSSACNLVDITYPNIKNVCDLDLYQYIKRTFKINNYKLDTCAQYFGITGKIDLSPEKMWEDWDNNKLDDIVKYCEQDCKVVYDIILKCSFVESIISLSNITYTSIDELFIKGQQYRMKNMLYIECFNNNYFMEFKNNDSVKYEGALVLDAVPGLYNDCAVMDFASLYPSIIISENICYSTYDIETDTFDKNKFGIIPNLIKRLVSERNVNKHDKPYANALKICANSIYGIFGSTGPLNHNKAASFITFIGRISLQKTVDYLSARNIKVIYGDTDSCIYNSEKVMTKQQHIDLAKEVSELFTKPMEMKFESIYKKFLLIKKKMYITMNDEDIIQYKGVIAVRRDRCQFAINLYKETVRRIFFNEPFRDYLRNQVLNVDKNNKELFALKRIYNGPYKNDNYPLAIYNRVYGPFTPNQTLFVFVSDVENQYIGYKFRPIDNKEYNVDYNWYLKNLSRSIDSIMIASNKVFRLSNNI